MNTSKGTEETNPQGAVEIKVDTVDYRSPAGQDQQPKMEKVQLIHQPHNDADSDTRGGGLAGAVAHTIQSAKDAIVGGSKDTAK